MSEDAEKARIAVQSTEEQIPGGAGDRLKLGATLVKDALGKVLGTNFAVYTNPNAAQAFVSLFDAQGKETRFALHRENVDPGKSNDFYIDGTPCDGIVWHGFVPNVRAGQQYGFRVDGPFQPEYGKTFHINRLLLDPYAKEVAGYPQEGDSESDYLHGGRSPSLLNYDSRIQSSLTLPRELESKDAPALIQWRSSHPVRHLPGDFNAYSKDQLLQWCEGKDGIGKELIDYWKQDEKATADVIRWHVYHHPFRKELDDPGIQKLDLNKRDVVYWNLLRNPLGEWGYNVTKFRAPDQDTAPYVPKGVVVDTEALKEKNYQHGAALHSLSDSLILEAHVREATIAYDQLPEGVKPGTYNALASDAFIEWFKGQGYTTLELMPIHLDDATTHWGYMTANFLAPSPKYADPNDPRSVTEQFADMVQKLRANGIETWMDVVYNHTSEGNHLGQVHSLKGLDERYYRKHYKNFLGDYYYDSTGTGNTLNTDHPRVRKLIMDSLEYFYNLGVSGFRFDLMHALGRNRDTAEYNLDHRLFKDLEEAVGPGGRLEGAKLSGEQWDCEGMGTLPPPIASWNRDHRETLRQASRLPGGIDAKSLRSTMVGVGDIKYQVSHDGLSVRDAVTGHGYGHGEDIALDCGGNEDERYRRQTYGIALEALSQGAVMRKMGSDRGHTQNGNHNPYDKQSEPVTRIPWGDKLKPELKQSEIMNFNGQAMRFKNAHPSLRRTRKFSETPDPEYKILSNEGDKDVTFFDNFGKVMTDEYQNVLTNKAFTYVLSGDTGRTNAKGEPVRDVPVMALINGAPGPAPVEFTIPGQSHIDGKSVSWKIAFDSGGGHTEARVYRAGETIHLPPFTAIALEANEFPGKEKVSPLAERAVNGFAAMLQAKGTENAAARRAH